MANAIVVEVLEFVRPIRLQVERVALDEVIKDSITLAEGKMRRGAVSIDASCPTTCRIYWPTRTSCGSCSRTCWRTRSRRSAAKGTSTSGRSLIPGDEAPVGEVEPQAPQVVIEVRDGAGHLWP